MTDRAAVPCRVLAVLASGLLVSLATDCSAVRASLPNASPAAGAHTDSPAAGFPLPAPLVKHLPGGVFYILAGTNPASYNLWEVTNKGAEIMLTHNASGLGISSFGASPAGIIMADASSGLDAIARLTQNGAEFLKDGRGSTPAINRAGQITYVRSAFDHANPYDEVFVKKSFTARRRMVYRQKTGITALSWGPGQSIAMLSGGHYPGTKGPTPKLLIINRKGHLAAIGTGLGKLLSNVTWGEREAGLAVNDWKADSKVIYSDGRRYDLPAGWFPAAWNPLGTELLLWKPDHSGSLGIWTRKHPRSIRNIGSLPQNTSVGEFAWLAKPAKL